jgi:hypothetical protein
LVEVRVMLVTLRNALRPADGARESVIVPVNPFRALTVIVEVAFGATFVPPSPSEAFAGTSGPTLVGLAVILKSSPAKDTT